MTVTANGNAAAAAAAVAHPFAYPSLDDYTSWKQQVGPDVTADPPSIHPPQNTPLYGHYVDLLPVTAKEMAQWWETLASPCPEYDRLWTYLLDGPWKDHTVESFIANQQKFIYETMADAVFYAVVPKLDHRTNTPIPAADRRALGRLALFRTDLPNRGTEVGHVIFSPQVHRSPVTTETFYLLGKHVFETLHFRRWEWKCHEYNHPSRAAAQRLGFTFEGSFRNHYIVKGRSRDTHWFSIIIQEWPVVKAAFEQWLAASNFDEHGNQREDLKAIRRRLQAEKGQGK